MNVWDYVTAGGKNLINEYLDKLQVYEKAEGYRIKKALNDDGLDALEVLNTRQLRNKLWEIKFGNNRLMYVIADKGNLYILHACKKQKGKAEKFEIDKAVKRAIALGRELNKDFI